MGNHRHLQTCTRGSDVVKCVTPQVKSRKQRGEDVEMRQSGTSHVVVRVETTFTVVPNTNKELGKGIRSAILKALIAMGFAVFIIMLVATI